MMLQLIISILLAIVISALCSMAEASFYSISSSTIETLQKNGKKSGKALFKIKNRIEHYIASILILNTIANSIGVVFATDASQKLFPEVPLILISGVLTILILLFAEVIPKTLGVHYSLKIATLLSIPFIFITKLMYPIIYLTILITKNLTPNKSNKTIYTPQEIESLASLSLKEGAIDQQQAKVIHNVLRLKLNNVRSTMTPRTVVFTQHQDLTIEESIKKNGNWNFSRVPIFDKDNEDLVGHVLRRDIYNALANGQENRKLKEFIRPLLFVPESLNNDQILRKFLSQHTHIAAVVEEYGGFAGIITLEDVLEEVLGKEIIDEFDTVIDMQEVARKKSAAYRKIQMEQKTDPDKK